MVISHPLWCGELRQGFNVPGRALRGLAALGVGPLDQSLPPSASWGMANEAREKRNRVLR